MADTDGLLSVEHRRVNFRRECCVRHVHRPVQLGTECRRHQIAVTVGHPDALLDAVEAAAVFLMAFLQRPVEGNRCCLDRARQQFGRPLVERLLVVDALHRPRRLNPYRGPRDNADNQRRNERPNEHFCGDVHAATPKTWCPMVMCSCQPGWPRPHAGWQTAGL